MGVPFRRVTMVFAHSSASSQASIRLRLLSLTSWRAVDIGRKEERMQLVCGDEKQRDNDAEQGTLYN